jgi:DNA-binding NtrC family response regulator
MRLLIVGSLQGQIGMATKIAMDRGAKVTHAGSIEQALSTLRGGVGADLVFCDVGLEIGSLVQGLAAERICTPVVACGIGTDTRRAVEAIRAGAKEYLPLPADPELIAAVLAAVADESHQLVHEDEAMNAVLGLADQIAGSEASILITGESGTGKEVMARYIHRKSHRADKSFISVNCAAIPENLLESELFGHEKGAFTGATERHMGKFVEASGGTLFLDEVGELPLAAQVKLLRALQEGTVEAVGGRKPVKVDVRIISATNRKLLDLVKSGAFREDLFYRLHVLPLTIPPLRMRREDVPHLLRHFLARFAAEENRTITGISGEAVAHLAQLDWPGNIRQLENTVYRAVVMSESDQLGLSDFPQTVGHAVADQLPHGEPLVIAPSTAPSMVSGSDIPIAPLSTAGSLSMLTATGEVRPLEEMENEIIRFAISHYRGQMSEVARRLKIGRSTLYRKLDEAASDDAAEGGAQNAN